MSKSLEESPLGGTNPMSSASPSESEKRKKTVPRYLRASTGSCHDLCKYGHKHSSEEELRISGGRRKKIPSHLNNLSLHRSTIFDRSKNAKNRSLSLTKSSISLGEAEWHATKFTPAIRKGAASNGHLVLQTTTSGEHKILSDDSKKNSMVADKAPTNLRYSSGTSKRDKKEASPAKIAIYSAKVKVPEKIMPEKSRTVDKTTTFKHSLLETRTASSSTEINMTKKVPAASQVSSHNLPSSKCKITPKGKVTPPAAAVTRVRVKSGRSPMRSTNANTYKKESSDIPGPSFSMKSKLTASVEKQDNLHVTGYSVESIPAQTYSDAAECVGIPEESNKSTFDDDMLGSAENSKALACEPSMEGKTAIELQQSLDEMEINAELHESSEHELAEQNVMDGRASKDENSQTEDASLSQLPEQLTTVENADVYVPLTQSNSKSEDDQVKFNLCVDSLNTEDKEELGVHGDLQSSVEILVLDKEHIEEPKLGHDIAIENAAENDKVDDVLDNRTNICASYCNSISEISSDGEMLEEPKSMLIVLVPSDSTVQSAASTSVRNENIESEELKSRIIIPQLPEELSDDEYYEEYDFEFSESDQSGTEDEESSVSRNRNESIQASDERPRRITALQFDDANATPYKLKFKRGKIVELPQDNSGPRRLKFRRRAVNEVLNRQSQLARRIYKRTNTDSVVSANPDVESSGVKLRHQDTQEKKDAQGLFNNVIEETASKLVESRKSKVKALVGAFETVISLQDGKPTSQAGNSQDLVRDGEGNAPEECK